MAISATTSRCDSNNNDDIHSTITRHCLAIYVLLDLLNPTETRVTANVIASLSRHTLELSIHGCTMTHGSRGNVLRLSRRANNSLSPRTRSTLYVFNIKTPLARSRHFSSLSCENNIQDLYKSPEYAKVANNSTKIRKLVTLLHVKIYLYYTN